MVSTSIALLALLLLPFILGYFHANANKKIKPVILYYRYFMSFNMIFAGAFVAMRMFFDGEHAATMSGWTFSPLFHMYGIALLSMAILGIITVYSKRSIMLAPAMLWATFVLLSTISMMYQITHSQVTIIGIVFAHIIYNIVSAIVMLSFVYVLYERTQEEPVLHNFNSAAHTS